MILHEIRMLLMDLSKNGTTYLNACTEMNLLFVSVETMILEFFRFSDIFLCGDLGIIVIVLSVCPGIGVLSGEIFSRELKSDVTFSDCVPAVMQCSTTIPN